MNGDTVTGQLNRIETSLEASIVLSRERFEMMDHRFERVDQRFEMMDRRFEEQMEFTRDRFALVDKHFKLMEDRFVEQKELSAKQYSLMDKRLDETNGILKNQFAMIITVTGVILAAVIGVFIQGYIG